MRFARPEMLWLLALVPALVVWLVWAQARRRKALQSFAEPALLERLVRGPGRGLLAAKELLLVSAMVFFVLAASRPQWGATTEQVTRQGVDVLIGIDISESMLAEDIAPSRLRKSQEEISRLLEKLRGDRVGLMAFAGSAGVLCPLTLDYNAVRIFLDELAPSLISHPGTSLGMALEVGAQAFAAQQKQYKVMILFSDGEDQVDAEEVEQRAQEAASQGLVVHSVGVGTSSGGPIPERGRDGSIIGYKKDSEGRVVTTRLDEKLMARVSEITGGIYQPASAAEAELDRLAEAIAGMDKKEMSARLMTQYEEQYQVPLSLGLLALVVDTFLTGRRRLRAAAPLALLGAVWLLSAGTASAASTPSLVEQGNRLYREGRLAEALQAYQQAEKLDPGNPAVQYNIGNVLYKQEQFDAAFDRYRRAFAAPQKPLSEGAHYNAGNTHFARKNWPEAIRHYREALEIDPADLEAKKNLELAMRAMEEERKQQQQQQKQQDQDQQDQNQDQNQQQKPERPQDQREQDAPRPQPREQRSPQQDPQQKLSRQEAMRILDAMKELDRPPKDPLKTPPPDKRPEKDW